MRHYEVMIILDPSLDKHTEGIYALLDVNSEPDAVKEMDRQLSLTESVLRTKVLRREPAKARKPKAAKAAKA